MVKYRNRLLAGFIVLMLFKVAGCASDTAVRSAVGEFSYSNWGQYRQTMQLSREDAVAKYNYCPTGGCVVRLESTDVKPSRAYKGENLTLTTAYTILTPEEVAIPVTISREIFFKGKSLGQARTTNTRNFNGTWSHQIDFSLPSNAAAGIYTLVTKVSTGYGSDRKSLEFTVE
jgi:hypothetical protein